MSGSGDRVERINAELAELDARLAKLCALADRIERFELEPGDRVLVEELISKYLAEAELSERGEAAVEEASAVWADGSTSESESTRGPFGVFARWMARR